MAGDHESPSDEVSGEGRSSADPTERFPVTFAFQLACPSCQAATPTAIELAYFAGTRPTCSTCGKRFDWLAELAALLREGKAFHGALAPAGAKWTVALITLQPRQNFYLDLSQHGVPATARVFYLGYTPQGGGGLFPVEWHGNVPDRAPSMRKTLVPIEIGSRAEVGPTKVAVMAAWVPEGGEPEAWSEFVRALEAHVAGDYQGAVIPASAATESAVLRLVRRVLDTKASKKHLQQFFKDAGFSDQLNVVLPALVSLTGLPVLPPDVRGRVNRLRELRNQIAHEGKPKNPITNDESASCLAAALLTHRYAHLIAEALHLPS